MMEILRAEDRTGLVSKNTLLVKRLKKENRTVILSGSLFFLCVVRKWSTHIFNVLGKDSKGLFPVLVS